jgi:hypothetical protein
LEALFIELPGFDRRRSSYLDDDGYARLQANLLENPECGDVIAGTGGLRKARFADERRGKGKRGGLRIIYFWWKQRSEFWLFTIYDKDEFEDLSPKDKKWLKDQLERELDARQ